MPMSSSDDPARRTVVVVGAINVDLVVVADRLPGPGETVVGAGLQQFGGGKGANAAVAAARAGAAVVLIGAVGADDQGAATLRDLAAEGIDVSHVKRLEGTATGVALIVTDSRGENQIAVGAGANAALTAELVEQSLAEVLGAAGCVLVSTEIPGDAVRAAVAAALAAGVPCVLNPAPVVPVVVELLALGPIVTPNASELLALARLVGVRWPDDVIEAAAAIVDRTGAALVGTLGSVGAFVLAPGAEPRRIDAPVAVARDTTGAGDTFNGVLAALLADKQPLVIATRTAVVAASLSVAHLGARTGMPTRAAIDSALAAEG